MALAGLFQARQPAYQALNLCSGDQYLSGKEQGARLVLDAVRPIGRSSLVAANSTVPSAIVGWRCNLFFSFAPSLLANLPVGATTLAHAKRSSLKINSAREFCVRYSIGDELKGDRRISIVCP